MPEFEYRAVDSSGQVITGGITASDLSIAKETIRAKGLILLEIKERAPSIAKSKTIYLLFRRNTIEDRELYNLFRELAILLRSGLTLDRALAILIDSVSNDTLRTVLEQVQRAIREGRSVTQAFSDASFLPPLMLSIISAGEAIGKLASAFENIADYYQFKINFKNELKSALAYPLFLIVASIITIFIVFRFILPRFFSLFADLDLPLPAKILYSIGLIFSKIKWYFLLILIFLFFFLTKMQIWNTMKQRLIQEIIKFPLIQKFIRELDLARFSHSMYSMLRS